VSTPETDKQAVNVIGWYSCATVPADFARKLERERDEAREKAERYRLEANAMMAKLHELQTYADKLADGLPAGMLPRDVENLREANDGLAEDLQKAEQERDEARDTVFRLRKQRAIARNFGQQMERERDKAVLELGAIQATIAEVLNLPHFRVALGYGLKFWPQSISDLKEKLPHLSFLKERA
jgi:hypothetical protein